VDLFGGAVTVGVALISGVLGYVVRPLIDDKMAARAELRKEQAGIRAETRVAAQSRNQEKLATVEAVLGDVRGLRDGNNPFREGVDDPLGTSGKQAFNARLDALIDFDDARGIEVKRHILKDEYDEAALLLREWRKRLL
jgi:hypothetical protein